MVQAVFQNDMEPNSTDLVAVLAGSNHARSLLALANLLTMYS